MSVTLLVAPAPARRILLAPGALHPAMTLARSQSASRATAFDGTTWSEYGAAQPRFAGSARRLLLEGARSNGVANPRAEGAAAGSPGTTPTGWTASASTNGLTRTILGTGTEDGIGYIDIRWAGTTTAASAVLVTPVAATATAAASGQAWTASAFLRLVGGSLTGLTGLTLVVAEYASGGGFLASGTTALLAGTTTAALRDQRRSLSRNLANASTASVGTYLQASYATGTTLDFTLRIGWPQLEQGGFASTPILPLAGSPAASTRGADQLSAALSAIGLGGACTLHWSGLLSANAPTGVDQILAQLDDGTDSNRHGLRNIAGGASLSLRRTTAGTASTATLGSTSAGSLFRAAMTLDASGRAAACLAGNALQATTGGPASGLTTLRLGPATSGTDPFAELAWVAIQPFAIPDGSLAGAAGAQPG